MHNSKRYQQLLRREAQLRKHLLPKLSPTGNYTKRQLDKTRAYRLLVHAELESYFEERGKDIAIRAVKCWDTTQKLSLVLIHLLSYSDYNWGNPPDSLTAALSRKGDVPILLTDKLNKALTMYISKLGNNHGIKEKNIFQILIPIGFQPADFDQVWLGTIDQFGTTRGEVAHTSVKAQQLIDPGNEQKKVALIIAGLKEIDYRLNTLAKQFPRTLSQLP